MSRDKQICLKQNSPPQQSETKFGTVKRRFQWAFLTPRHDECWCCWKAVTKVRATSDKLGLKRSGTQRMECFNKRQLFSTWRSLKTRKTVVWSSFWMEYVGRNIWVTWDLWHSSTLVIRFNGITSRFGYEKHHSLVLSCSTPLFDSEDSSSFNPFISGNSFVVEILGSTVGFWNHMSNQNKPGCLGYCLGMKSYPVISGYFINHYKDPINQPV